MNANVRDQGEKLEALVRHAQPVDVARLGDLEVDLSDLVR